MLGLITLGILPILSLFLPGSSPAVPIAVHMNLMVGWTFIAIGISMVIGSVVRANGAVIVPFIILVLSTVVMRFSVGFLLHPHWGADAIWAAFGSSAMTSLLLTLAYYVHGGWKKSKMAAV